MGVQPWAQYAADVAIWVGAASGMLTIVDWILSEAQKKKIRLITEDIWLWIANQKAGQFVRIIRSDKSQFILVAVPHIILLATAILFMLRTIGITNITVKLDIGHPRIYIWQAWIDAASITFSLFIVNKYFYPKFRNRLITAPSTGRYLVRAGLAFLKAICVMIIAMLLQIPIFDLEDAATATLPDDHSVATEYLRKLYIEEAFGGPLVVAALHFITSCICAPILAKAFITCIVFILSICWIALIYIAEPILRIADFIVYRLAVYEKGPVIALSVLLTGIGAVAKALS